MTTRIVVECRQCAKEINGARLIVTLRVRVGLEVRDLIEQELERSRENVLQTLARVR